MRYGFDKRFSSHGHRPHYASWCAALFWLVEVCQDNNKQAAQPGMRITLEAVTCVHVVRVSHRHYEAGYPRSNTHIHTHTHAAGCGWYIALNSGYSPVQSYKWTWTTVSRITHHGVACDGLVLTALGFGHLCKGEAAPIGSLVSVQFTTASPASSAVNELVELLSHTICLCTWPPSVIICLWMQCYTL